MPHLIKLPNVDIYELPSAEKLDDRRRLQFTIGDLHANTMKLIFMLVKHGVIVNLSKEDYASLVKIYLTSVELLNSAHIELFNAILSKVSFKNVATIRLIGDELADRGSNDYFTLKVIEKLRDNGVRFEVLFSNHGIEYVETYENYQNRVSDKFAPPMLDFVFSRSLHNLESLISRGLIKREEVNRITKESYLPFLKAISYSIDIDKSAITIYSHAAIGLQTIEGIAKLLGVIYCDNTVKDLAETIDKINKKIQDHIANKRVGKLFPQGEMQTGYEGQIAVSNPLVFLLWNRFYDNIDRPKTKNGFNLYFVHGHDRKGLTKNNTFNIDNDLGKLPERNIGDYTVVCDEDTPEFSLSPNKQKTVATTKPMVSSDKGAEAEAKRKEAERKAAESERKEAERKAAEAERKEAERKAAEAERKEAERKAAEAERKEAERKAAEAERKEAERKAAEAERKEAERKAAEAERKEAERKAAEAERKEAEKKAAEAERKEAERKAAEAEGKEAERKAAEAERKEAERKAAESKRKAALREEDARLIAMRNKSSLEKRNAEIEARRKLHELYGLSSYKENNSDSPQITRSFSGKVDRQTTAVDVEVKGNQAIIDEDRKLAEKLTTEMANIDMQEDADRKLAEELYSREIRITAEEEKRLDNDRKLAEKLTAEAARREAAEEADRKFAEQLDAEAARREDAEEADRKFAEQLDAEAARREAAEEADRKFAKELAAEEARREAAEEADRKFAEELDAEAASREAAEEARREAAEELDAEAARREAAEEADRKFAKELAAEAAIREAAIREDAEELLETPFAPDVEPEKKQGTFAKLRASVIAFVNFISDIVRVIADKVFGKSKTMVTEQSPQNAVEINGIAGASYSEAHSPNIFFGSSIKNLFYSIYSTIASLLRKIKSKFTSPEPGHNYDGNNVKVIEVVQRSKDRMHFAYPLSKTNDETIPQTLSETTGESNEISFKHIPRW